MNRVSIFGRAVFFTALLLGASTAWATQCDNEAASFGLSMIINKGMLEMVTGGPINRADIDLIGEQSRVANEHLARGEFQKACDVQDAVIAKFGFKTFEESYYEAHPEKRVQKPTEGASSKVSNSEEAAVSASSAEDGAAVE